MHAIKDPSKFLEKLVDDTWSDKIIWSVYESEYGIRYITIISIPKTKKYIRIEIFDAGKFSVIKSEIVLSISKIIEFEGLRNKENQEIIVRLLLAIRRQIEAKIVIVK